MKERPILFSAPMVRALLAGKKTQTRRAMRVQPGDETTVHVEHFNQTVVDRHGEEQPGPEIFGAWWDDGESGLSCPYGGPSDRLWVRENGWERPPLSQRDLREGADTWPRYEYDAEPLMCWEEGELKKYGWKRRPSIHMPRWASRITLEVTDVRVQRLHDITADDAMAEGIVRLHDGGYAADKEGRHYHAASAWYSYASLWETINGRGSWEANPWVWAVSFKRWSAAA